MRPHAEKLFALSVAATAGCLSPAGGVDTTLIDPSTGDAGASAIDTGSTGPGIMTTTVEAETDAPGATTDAARCGDGELQDGEDCDDGPGNADDAACTSACALATCGDGLVRAGVEACDDGANNGAYGSCSADCSGPGPRCGDGVLQLEFGEACEDPTPSSGCLKDTCTPAESCLQIKNVWLDEASDGIYTVQREDQALQVYCAMNIDEGGYTFLKKAAPEATVFTAALAEEACEQHGMRLFVPRSADHLAKAVEVARTTELPPIGGLDVASAQAYLGILGVYPKKEGESCPGAALNSVDCPAWVAGVDEPYWISGESLSATEPSAKACKACSMAYGWDETTDPPTLDGYQVLLNKQSATSTHVLCDPSDWTGQAT